MIVQASVLIGNFTVGLAGLGALGLATTFSMFADRLDSLIRRTIYPAVCAVKDRTALLFEAFEKSNRLALMWAFPFGVGLALFAPDLITFVLGERWREAEVLLQVFGLTIAVRQVAFNWVIFFSAIGDNRPLAVSSFVQLGVFAVVTAPLMIAFGLNGYAAGMAVAVLVDLGVRGYYLGRLFEGFAIGRHLVRSVVPSVPPAHRDPRPAGGHRRRPHVRGGDRRAGPVRRAHRRLDGRLRAPAAGRAGRLPAPRNARRARTRLTAAYM